MKVLLKKCTEQGAESNTENEEKRGGIEYIRQKMRKKKGESINGKSKEIDRIFINSGNDFDHAANADSGGRG